MYLLCFSEAPCPKINEVTGNLHCVLAGEFLQSSMSEVDERQEIKLQQPNSLHASSAH